MKRKKLLSMAVAGMLVAAQMAMPAMAADGTIEANLTVNTGVLKVQVPTAMAVAIDQFELTTAGVQIKADDFVIKNYSEMPVKVKVTSEATLGNGITLVPEKASANSAAASAWLAVAAKTGDASYDDTKTAGTTETLGTLTEANVNVVPFVAATKKAEQYFYLEKATGTAVYKVAADKTSNLTDKTYTKFYELTLIDSASWTGDANVKTAAADKDIYWAAAAVAENTTLNKVPKGDAATGAYNASRKYYSVSPTGIKLNDLDVANSKKYMYAAMPTLGTTNSTASFTYIGKLSSRREAWTSTDIAKITIEYNISGVAVSKYDALAPTCTYGVNTPTVTLSTAGLIEIKGLTAEANIVNAATDLTLGVNNEMYPINNSAATWTTGGWTVETGGTLKAQLNAPYAEFNGKEVTVNVKLSNGRTIAGKATVTIQTTN